MASNTNEQVDVRKIVNKGFTQVEEALNKMKKEPITNKKVVATVTNQKSIENKVKEGLQEFKKIKQLEKKDYRKFEMYANFTDAQDEYHKKWGVITAPLVYMSKDGLTPISSTHKGYFKYPKDEQGNLIEVPTAEAYQKLIPNGTVVLPHEEAHERIDKAINNFNKSNKSSVFGTFKLEDDWEAHRTFTHYWQYLSDKQYDVKKDDTVQFGISFRNGIGTRVSLGGDLYSYRLSCENGAIVRDVKIGSFNIPHIISSQRMLEKLTDSLAYTIENYKKLLDYYKAFNITKLTQSLVDKILKKADLPLKYLPTDILNIRTKKDDKDLEEVEIKLHNKDATFWDLFNGITNPLTRAIEETSESKRLAFNAFSKRTSRLHKAMMPLVTVGSR